MISVIAWPNMLMGVLTEFNMDYLQELQHFAEVGKISAGLIHDLSSPLTAAILHLERSEQTGGLPSISHARRSIKVLERYLDAARQQLLQGSSSASFRIKPEINQARCILQPLARQRQVNLYFKVPGDYCLHGDPVKFQRILANLVTNAIDAYGHLNELNDTDAVTSADYKKRQVLVSVQTRGQNCIIRVQDWGGGIKKPHLEHIFEPFYTTKKALRQKSRAGTGIGLATVKKYVEEDFLGNITVASRIGGNTTFRITIPLDKSSRRH